MKKLLILLFLLLPVLGLAEDGPSLFLSGNDLTALQNIDDSSSILSLLSEEQPQEEPEPEKVNPIREKWIDEIIALSKTMYERTGGKAQRAHESGDIYICKNYTIYLFRQTAGKYRMAGYPDKKLIIPDNLPRAECAPYAYGIAWKEVSAKDGNPFYAAAEFRYDEALSEAENYTLATQFMQEVQRGDFFQMSAEYKYGLDAHSLIFMSDYDPATNTVHWTDSNMRGFAKDEERYAYVQYDAVEDISFFADAICHKKRGATIYRLYEDIIAR